jgi:hypothetical protein
MTVIARWECPKDGELAGWWSGLAGHGRLYCGACGTPMEKVEYVPAEQLTGAVAAMREARAALIEQREPDAERAVLVIDRYLNGGQ